MAQQGFTNSDFEAFLKTPVSQYMPLSQVAFAPYQPVMPHDLPPSSVPPGDIEFPQAQWIKDNFPSVMTIFKGYRSPQQGVG